MRNPDKDSIWERVPESPDECDAIDRKRRKALLSAAALLAIAIAVNVAVNESGCTAPAPERAAEQAASPSQPESGAGSSAAASPSVSLDATEQQLEATGIDPVEAEAALAEYCKERGIGASSAYATAVIGFGEEDPASTYLEVELRGPAGEAVGSACVVWSEDYGLCAAVPVGQVEGSGGEVERTERGGAS